MTQRVKILLLVGLLLILGTQLFFSGLEPDDSDIGGMPAPSRLETALGSSQDPQASIVFSRPPSSDFVELNTPRNIFAPLKKPRAPKKNKPITRPVVTKKKPTPRVAAKPVSPKPVLPAGPTPEELAKRQAEQEMNTYRFLGYLERAGEQHVFLSNGQALYIVKQGETVEGAITLKTIMESSVVLSKLLTGTGTTVEATLPLTKEGKGT